MTNIILSLFIQSAQLIYTDIFLLTQPNFEKTLTFITTNKDNSITTTETYLPETNPIAKVLFQNNLYVIGFALAIGANAYVTNILFPKSPDLAAGYLAAVNIGEILAISRWLKGIRSTIQVNAIVYAKEF